MAAMDEAALTEVLSSLIAGKRVDAAARLANALVTVLSVGFLGPGAVVYPERGPRASRVRDERAGSRG